MSMMRLLLAFVVLMMGGVVAQAACHSQAGYTVCEFDAGVDKIALYNLDGNGQPYGGFEALQKSVAVQGQQLTFVMNAGMFGVDLKPIGL